MTKRLDPALASRLARIALGHIGREYPHKLDHVVAGDRDLLPPRALHPVFFGSFDWHSCVHGWWTLLTLRRRFPAMAESAAIVARADESFTAANVTAELAYLQRPLAEAFERPYGWAWLLALHREAAAHPDCWVAALEPLARAVAERLRHYLDVLTYPVRSGTHGSSAFAMILSLPWGDAFDLALAKLIRRRCADWFDGDRNCQAWEPGGEDFLSPALVEALCWQRCWPAQFADWFAGFLPGAASGQPVALFTPALVSDHHDGKIVHLDGLNLSRAWCWRSLAEALPAAARATAERAAAAHVAAALPHLGDDYAGEHWLGSFLLLALVGDDPPEPEKSL